MEPVYKRVLERLRQFSESLKAPDAKPLWTQIFEIVKLRLGAPKISARHYFWMNFGNKKIYENVDLADFGGTYHTIALHEKLNSPYWDAIVTDKLIMSLVFSRTNIPQPTMYAAAFRYKRQLGDLPVFHDRKSLVTFISESIPYPFFCKPIKGGSAKGCQRVDRYTADGKLALADGRQMPPGEFVDSLEDPEGWGYLFQEAVMPHPDTRAICGDAVSGCRVVMLLGDDGPRIFRVVWKLPSRSSYVDNFVDGTTGCWQADVDPASGRVTRVVAGTFTDVEVNPPLPESGRRLLGERIPDWDKLKLVMNSAALAFPGFRFQHWDVGLTSKGPIVYELNTAGAIYGLELARGEGIFDQELKTFLAQYANQATKWRFAGGPPVDQLPAAAERVSTLSAANN